MSASKIEWTEQTWNPIVGCSLESPGCTNCYAMKLAGRLALMGTAAHYRGTTQKTKAGFVWTGKINVAPDSILLAPLKRRKPTTYFVNSMSDLFHPDVPDKVIDRVFAVMALCPQHKFQVLTKRSARMRAYMTAFENRPDEFGAALAFVVRAAGRPREAGLAAIDDMVWPPLNVWLGVSVEDQPRADERRDDFKATPAAVKFVSYEPALGAVEWAGWEFVDQIIGGGESGPNARPTQADWQRATRNFCAAQGIAYFLKQWGDWYPAFANDHAVNAASIRETREIDGAVIHRVGKRAAGRLLDGVAHDGMPA